MGLHINLENYGKLPLLNFRDLLPETTGVLAANIIANDGSSYGCFIMEVAECKWKFLQPPPLQPQSVVIQDEQGDTWGAQLTLNKNNELELLEK